jgi:hypothetical protein
VLDLLATFYDEDVKLPECRRLFQRCLGHLERLGAAAPVVISARLPPAEGADRLSLVAVLRSRAAETWELEVPQAVISCQLSAFS